jgi:hypothetical protein
VIGSNPFVIAGAGLVVAPGPGLTVGEVANRGVHLARVAIGSTRRVARALVLSLARRAAAELSKLTRWRVAEVEAIEAMVAPMAPARGPPTHGVGNPCERPPRECEICQTTTRKAGPNMAFKCKEAPRRFLARGSLLSIFCQDPRYGAQPPVSVYSVAAPCATRTCAAGSKAGRDVDFLD